MTLPSILAEAAGELALFAALGFLLFSLDDLLVDGIYFVRSGWRALTIYRRHPRSDALSLAAPTTPGWIVVFIPAWDEAAVIGAMLRSTLQRFDHPDLTFMVGHYRNDPATAYAIREVADPRVIAVEVPASGPTTKADCLNHLYAFLVRHEAASGRRAKAIVLHDAEDLVHLLELKLFDRLIERAGVVQLPVVPLPRSRQPLDWRPLSRRVRREPWQGTGRAGSSGRVDPARRGRLRHPPRRHCPPRFGSRRQAFRRRIDDRGL